MGLRYRLRQWGLDHLGEPALGWLARRTPSLDASPAAPRSILVLRNNDLGDLLVATPLFEALKRRFPTSQLTAAVGPWSAPVLAGNPFVDEVLPLHAPWFNKFVQRQSLLARLRYVATSAEVEALKARRFEVGIDVLGSLWGALLLLEAGIPWRLGMSGYAGGAAAFQQAVAFNPDQHVGRGALRFAELLGATELPAVRPQLFLTALERAAGEAVWEGLWSGRRRPRLVIAPGGGLVDKRWPEERFAELLARLAPIFPGAMLLLGGPGEHALGGRLAAPWPRVRNTAGQLSLRETFAVLAAADAVITGSTMAMHAAAAFGKPMVVLLGESFVSAAQHDRQWGYPELGGGLGKEPRSRPEVASVAEAMAAVSRLLGRVEEPG